MLSQSVLEGVKSVPGVEALMYRFEETLPEEVLVKMQAVPRPDFPVITPALLVELDAMILCFPTRFDRAPAEVATFFDKVRA